MPPPKALRRFAVLILCFFWMTLGHAAAQEVEELRPQTAPAPAAAAPKPLKLIQALVCEEVLDGIPKVPAIVFAITVGKVSCYTFFDPVPANTHVTHNWYYRDEPSARIQLKLRPPRWATFSTIQLREGDKGPWRVEITDADGVVLKVLRFSITD